jgi:hypothetical protein
MRDKKHQLVKIKYEDYLRLKDLAKEQDRTIQGALTHILKQYIQNQGGKND